MSTVRDILSTMVVFSTMGDIMLNVGGILSTMLGVQYCGGYLECCVGVQYHGGYHEYYGGYHECHGGVQYHGGIS